MQEHISHELGGSSWPICGTAGPEKQQPRGHRDWPHSNSEGIGDVRGEHKHWKPHLGIGKLGLVQRVQGLGVVGGALPGRGRDSPA